MNWRGGRPRRGGYGISEQRRAVKPTGGVIAVAGPVTDGEIDLTNSP